MNIQILPKSTSGKWSVGLCVSFFVFIGLFFTLVASGQRGGVRFLDNLVLALPTIFAALSAVLGLFFGLISVVKYKERALLTFVSIVVGAFVLYFTIGESASKH
jgi:hypothetical protein